MYGCGGTALTSNSTSQPELSVPSSAQKVPSPNYDFTESDLKKVAKDWSEKESTKQTPPSKVKPSTEKSGQPASSKIKTDSPRKTETKKSRRAKPSPSKKGSSKIPPRGSPTPVLNPPPILNESKNNSLPSVNLPEPTYAPAPIRLDRSYRSIRVKLFPIDKVYGEDPYKKSDASQTIELFNSNGFVISLDSSIQYDANHVAINLQTETLRFLDRHQKISFHGKKEVSILPRTESLTDISLPLKRLKNLSYRGQFAIVTNTESSQSTDRVFVNVVPLEHYTASVASQEIGTSYGKAAVEAQVIAARTYVLYHALGARQVEGKNWDVDPTVKFQAYLGKNVERQETQAAVASTAGKVLTYQGQPIIAYFSSSSGGHTTTPGQSMCYPSYNYEAKRWLQKCSLQERLQLDAKTPYLVGRPDPIVRDGLGHEFAKTFMINTDTILNALRIKNLFQALSLPNDNTIKNSDFTQIRADEVVHGRIQRLSLQMRNAQWKTLNEADSYSFRSSMKWSNNFCSLQGAQNKIQRVTCFGNGHGVGMSQWGAMLMSQQGATAQQILNFYYHNVQIQQL